MKLILILIPLLALGACTHPAPPKCDDGDVSPIDYVDQRTGKLIFNDAGDVLDPETGHVVITAAQVRCRERNDQAAINAYEAVK